MSYFYVLSINATILGAALFIRDGRGMAPFIAMVAGMVFAIIGALKTPAP